MRIAFIIPSMLRGGAERAMSILCNEFVVRDNDVSLYLTEIPDKIEYPLDSKVKVKDLTVNLKPYASRIPIYINKIRKQVKKDRIDIVVSFITRTNIYAIIACRMAGVPVIFSERNNPYVIPSNPKLRKLRDFVYKYADGSVFQTSYARDYYSSKIADKSVIIMNPVSEYDRPLVHFKERKNIIVTACRLEPQKNLALLINAFAKIAQKIPEYNLYIYGDGSLREDLKNLINSLELSHRIELKGIEKNVIGKFAEAKMFVLSSDFEGLSNSLTEALCAGAACVVTDSPTYGNRDLITDGKNGFIVPVGEVDTLAEKMLQLATDVNLMERFSQESQKTKEKVGKSIILGQWYKYMSSTIDNCKKTKTSKSPIGGGKLLNIRKLKNYLVSKLLQKLGLGCETASMLRARGVKVGERLQNYGIIDYGHGSLITIGDDVIISAARILTHDGSTKLWTGYSKIGHVTIGNRVFIGAGAIILPNVTIGDDVIIGAGSVVNRDVPSNSVVVGSPAKVVGTLEDYINKNKANMHSNVTWNTYWKKKSKEEVNEIRTKLLNGGWGYDI